MVAVHLLKAVNYWSDIGLGDFGLHYIRDKEKREVDFVVVKDGEPWFLVEDKKSSNTNITSALHRFHAKLGTQHAFQVAQEMDFINKNCFDESRPIIVPAQTLLSQLI